MSSIKDQHQNFWISDIVTDQLARRIDELQTIFGYYTDYAPSSSISIVTNNLEQERNKYIKYLDNILAMYKEIREINLETNSNMLLVMRNVAINRLAIYEAKILEELN